MHLQVLHKSMMDKVTQQELGDGSWIASPGVSGRQPGREHDINQKITESDCDKQENRVLSLEGSIHKESV